MIFSIFEIWMLQKWIEIIIIIINIQSALGNTVSISSRYSSNVAAITWYYRYRL